MTCSSTASQIRFDWISGPNVPYGSLADGNAIDLGGARSASATVEEDPVHDEASARRRDMAAIDGYANVDHAAMAVLVVLRTIFQLPSNRAANAG